jgi:hypothetical protein
MNPYRITSTPDTTSRIRTRMTIIMRLLLLTVSSPVARWLRASIGL